MTLDDDRARLAYLTGRLDDGFALWVTEARDLLRMAEDGIAAREEAERLRALALGWDFQAWQHEVGRLTAERDAAHAALRAVEALADRFERADVERYNPPTGQTVAAKVANIIAEHYPDGVPSG